jgi:hypothetical protein
MGTDTTFVFSQDKARVPLGLAAAHKALILMHVRYRVTLPDHDSVVANGHKLIPSVYAALGFNGDQVGYSGPTYVAIRSGKHDTSTAATHHTDFHTMSNLLEFDTFVKTSGDSMKPVVIVLVDGGPDENPRYQKNIALQSITFAASIWAPYLSPLMRRANRHIMPLNAEWHH